MTRDKRKVIYTEPTKDGDLAELIGVVLDDGHIAAFPRTEELSIFSNKIGCIRIRIYQKHIQARLGVPFSPEVS